MNTDHPTTSPPRGEATVTPITKPRRTPAEQPPGSVLLASQNSAVAYIPGEAGSVWRKRESDNKWAQVLDWCPVVHEVSVQFASDECTPVAVLYTLSVPGTDRRVTINAFELRANGKGWEVLRGRGVGSSTMRAVLYDIVTNEAASLPELLVLNTTGWHNASDGARFYLRADGATIPAGVGESYRLSGGVNNDVCAAVGKPFSELSVAEIRAGILSIVAHGGFPALFDIGVAVRAFSQSLAPIRRGIFYYGEPGSGKSSAQWAGRSVHMLTDFEPLATSPIGAGGYSIPALTVSANFERDMYSIYNDIAIDGRSTMSTRNSAQELIDKLYRDFANGNNTRAAQQRNAATGNYENRDTRNINSVFSMSGQTHAVRLLQASAIRRLILIEIRAGDVDGSWWAANAPELAISLRNAGARVLEWLARTDAVEEAVSACDKAGSAALEPFLKRAGLPTDPATVNQFGETISAAGAFVGGLYMLAHMIGAGPGDIVTPDFLSWLAGNLVQQINRANEVHATGNNIADAVAEIVRRELSAGHAHIRKGDSPFPAIPGIDDRAQGIEKDDYAGYKGRGVVLYYLETEKMLAVTSENLHILLTRTPDARLPLFSARNITRVLVKEGEMEIIGPKYRRLPGVAGTGRFNLIPVGQIFPGSDSPEDEGGAPIAPILPPDVTEAVQTVLGAFPEGELVSSSVGMPTRTVIVGQDGGTVGSHVLRLPLADGLGAVLSAVATQVGTDSLVLVDGAAAAVLRAGKAPRAGGATELVAAATAAGWTTGTKRERERRVPALENPWMTFTREDRTRVRVGILPWLAAHDDGRYFPLADDDATVMLSRMAEWETLMGAPYRGTPGTAATDALVAIGRPMKYEPTWRPANNKPEWLAAELDYTAGHWGTKKLPAGAIGIDRNLAYLSALSSAELGAHTLRQNGAKDYVKGEAGMYLIDPSPWNASIPLPNPAGYGKSKGPRWVSHPTVNLLTQLTEAGVYGGFSILDSYTDKGVRKPFEEWAKTIQAAHVNAQDPTVKAAAKSGYREAIGSFGSASAFVPRPDWQNAIIAQTRVSIFRDMRKQYDANGAVPLRVDTDCIWYPEGTEITTYRMDESGMSLGTYKTKTLGKGE